MLRSPDLIAKTAGVTLKDTLRVLLAADLVAWFQGESFEQMLAEAQAQGLSSARPGPDNVAACAQGYEDLQAALRDADPDIRRQAARIADFK